MGNIFKKISRNLKGLEVIKEKAEASLNQNSALLTQMLSERAECDEWAIAGGRQDAQSTQNPVSAHPEPDIPDISIIVPVFNAALHLAVCLDSLVNQTHNNVEIICIDNGSTDTSLEILNEYAIRDRRIVVAEQRHQGISAARNCGLQLARAPYLMFCDSDDWYELNTCRIMLDVIQRECVDAVVSETRVVYQVATELRQNYDEYLRLKYVGKQKITQEILLSTNVSLWNKIFKRSIVEEHNISFPEGLIFEDAYFFDAYMRVSECLYYLPVPLYNYLRHDTSVMTDTYKKSGTAADHLKIVMRIWDKLETDGMQKAYVEYFWKRFFEYAILAFKHLKGADQVEAKQMALAFINEHKESLSQASPATQTNIKLLLSGKFEMLHKIYRFPKWLNAKLSITRDVFSEITWLVEQNRIKQSMIQELLGKREDDSTKQVSPKSRNGNARKSDELLSSTIAPDD